MTWKKGQSGNPNGLQLEKHLREQLRIVGNELDPVSGRRKLRRIAEKLFDKGLQGDLTAIGMIGDRLDGKPAQESTVNISNQRVEELSDQELVAIIRQHVPTSENNTDQDRPDPNSKLN